MDDSFEPDGNEEEADDEAAAEVYQTSGEPAEGGDEPGPKATAKPNTVFPGGMQRPQQQQQQQQQLLINRRKTLVDEIVAKARKKV